jgi:hypothetical protein
MFDVVSVRRGTAFDIWVTKAPLPDNASTLETTAEEKDFADVWPAR